MVVSDYIHVYSAWQKIYNHSHNYMKLHPYWCVFGVATAVGLAGSDTGADERSLNQLAWPSSCLYWLLAGLGSRQDPKDELLLCHAAISVSVGMVQVAPPPF